MRCHDCHNRIKKLRDNFATALKMVNALLGLTRDEPRYLNKYSLDRSEMQDVADGLHDLYFTAMFASFESALRNYWRARGRRGKPQTKVLIASIAAIRVVEQDTLDMVQEIRNFRNSLVHEDHEIAKKYTIEDAIGPLNKFLARLPLEW